MTRIVCHSPVAQCRALLCILCGALRVRNVLFHTINLHRCWPENSMGGLIAAFLPMPWLPSRRWRPKASCTETVSLRQPLQPPRCEKRILGIWSPYSCDLMDLVAARWIGGCGMVACACVSGTRKFDSGADAARSPARENAADGGEKTHT